MFGAIATVVTAIHDAGGRPAVAVPIEVSGAVIALVLVLRTNAGYERWWEARKLWGGIVNQSRNLVVSALAYGPEDPAWRSSFVRWTAAFSHVALRTLRGERELPEVCALLGEAERERLAVAGHMPTHVLARIAELLHDARGPYGLDGFAFEQMDQQRTLLAEHVGGCERIVKTPLAFAYAVKIRRFIVLYLVLVPFGLVTSLGWLTPLVTMFISYPILSLDHIGTELQNPFSKRSLSHLPLDEICATVEGQLLSLLSVPGARSPSESSAEQGGHLGEPH